MTWDTVTHTHILVSLYSIEALRFLHSECTSYCLTTLRSRKLFEFIIQICTNTKTTSQASIGTVIIKIDQLRRTLYKEQSQVISKPLISLIIVVFKGLHEFWKWSKVRFLRTFDTVNQNSPYYKASRDCAHRRIYSFLPVVFHWNRGLPWAKK